MPRLSEVGPYKVPEYPDEFVTLEITLADLNGAPDIEVTYNTGAFLKETHSTPLTQSAILGTLVSWNLTDDAGEPLALDGAMLPLRVLDAITRGIVLDAQEHVRGWKGYSPQRDFVRRVRVEQEAK